MWYWNEERIRFMRDAAFYPGLHRRLAAELLPLLREGSVCDAGCGIGQLSVALAPFVPQITAVDIDASALSVLREAGLPNVETVCADLFALPEHLRFGNMVFCFFGTAEEILRCAAAHCDGTVVIIKKDTERHRFAAGTHPEGSSYARAVSELKARGISYSTKLIDADMGQPFRSLEDAVRFFSAYDRNDSGIDPETVAARLVKGPSEEFPLFYPCPCRIGMIFISASDLSKATE